MLVGFLNPPWFALSYGLLQLVLGRDRPAGGLRWSEMSWRPNPISPILTCHIIWSLISDLLTLRYTMHSDYYKYHYDILCILIYTVHHTANSIMIYILYIMIYTVRYDIYMPFWYTYYTLWQSYIMHYDIFTMHFAILIYYALWYLYYTLW